MRRLGKILVGALVVLVVLLAAAITFSIGWRPFIGPRIRPTTARTFERTPERLARGQYIVMSVSPCMDCHSPHDWKAPGYPIVTGMLGAGEIFPEADLPGNVVAPNLTPDKETGLGNWSDDEISRAIREGVSKDGRALFPLMPYQRFRNMSDEDVASAVVFLRSLPPVRNPLPVTQIIAPVKYLIRDVPQPITSPVPQPDTSTPEKRGAYLAQLSVCTDCHTPQKKGAPIPGMEYAGGQVFAGPWGTVASVNITPDATGISYYDQQLFRDALRDGHVRARKLSDLMPWEFYKGMTDEDINALFAYLKTVKPIAHRVDNGEAPGLCRLDGHVHGLGAKN